MTKEYNLKRFEEMENSYQAALHELRNGRKTGHWIWWVFPQLKGLGDSYESTYYGIENLNEAKAYLKNDRLRQRLETLCAVLLDLKESDPKSIMGRIDAMKLCSSMTLFAEAAGAGCIYERVLDRFYGGERDNETIKRLYPKKTN